MFVKICGLSSADAVQAAVDAGANAVGFVFAESPRRVTPAKARELCRGLPENLIRVAVMRHPSPAEWNAVQEEFRPDWLQTDADDFSELELDPGCEPLPVYRNGQQTALTNPERILFEGIQSGKGELADWSEAASIAARARLILAGGLDADNVAAAIDAVAPWGVDVSSGVERRPGEKDPAKIDLFIARARAAETRQ
ncbi:MAG: phosphoribosylanthranilate isomerase [Candidatus Rariloculaceae bacterium]